jgi:hypothetical protein
MNPPRLPWQLSQARGFAETAARPAGINQPRALVGLRHPAARSDVKNANRCRLDADSMSIQRIGRDPSSKFFSDGNPRKIPWMVPTRDWAPLFSRPALHEGNVIGHAKGPGPASLNSGYGSTHRSINCGVPFWKGEERRFLLIFGRRQARYGRACQERFSGGGSPLLARCFSQ